MYYISPAHILSSTYRFPTQCYFYHDDIQFHKSHGDGCHVNVAEMDNIMPSCTHMVYMHAAILHVYYNTGMCALCVTRNRCPSSTGAQPPRAPVVPMPLL